MLDADNIAKVAKGSDVVMSSYGPPSGPQGPDPTKAEPVGGRHPRADCRACGARVRPASSWWAAREVWKFRPGCRLSTRRLSRMPTSRIALAHRDAITRDADSDLNWTYFSPAMMIQPGERTGKFRLGKDALMSDAKATARFRPKTTPSRWWTKWSRGVTPSSASPLGTEASGMDAQQQLKQAAAESAVALVEDGMILGLGTGSTAKLAVDALGKRVASAGCASLASRRRNSRPSRRGRSALPVSTLDEHPEIDLTIDGADEVRTWVRSI